MLVNSYLAFFAFFYDNLIAIRCISLMFLVICEEILGSGRVGYRTNCPFEFSPTFVQRLYLKNKYSFSYSVVPG